MPNGVVMNQRNLPSPIESIRLLHNLLIQRGDCTIRKADKPLVLYGAGDLGKMAKEYFEKLNIPFLYVVDADSERYIGSTTWRGIPVIKPEDVPKEDRVRCLLVICVATASYVDMTTPLIKQGWQDIVPFYDITEAYIDKYPLSNGWFTGPLDNDGVEGVEYVMNHWGDDISRAHYLQFIAWHSLRQELIFSGASVTTGDRFFIPEIISVLHEDEVFLDGGAHHGEVILRFMVAVHNKFVKAYAIEPDKYNAKVLRNILRAENVSSSRSIEIIECALGKKSGTATFFHGLDYASQFSSMAQESVPVRVLDEIDIPATFIKLHLEGWEFDALQGASCYLNKYRPLLVVTTYHKRNGLWQLPSLLMKKLTDYVFLLRLHSWMGTGCVLYAIPRERYLSNHR